MFYDSMRVPADTAPRSYAPSICYAVLDRWVTAMNRCSNYALALYSQRSMLTQTDRSGLRHLRRDSRLPSQQSPARHPDS